MSINQNKVDQTRPFLDHLIEFRTRILFTVISFFLIFLISYFTAPYFIDLIKQSAKTYNINLNIFKVTESVSIYMKVMFFQSLCVTIPILVFQIYLFIKPALKNSTNKIAIYTLPVVSLLFMAGALIGLKIFVPLLLSFFLNVSENLSVETVYSFTDFFTFVFTVCLIFGFILELPAILSFLTLLNVITPKKLKQYRKFAYPLLCFFSVIVTPPDVVTDLIVMMILFMIYEISIYICDIFSRIRTRNMEKLIPNEKEVT